MVEPHMLDYIVIAIYFLAVLVCGIWFGQHTKSTQDFFFGGQRFSWWLVAISCVATLVGSYSFIQYSETAFTSGISSTICYTNDWFIIPLFVLAWLPIIYFSRVTSIPEYFERRFDARTRTAALFVILVYLIGYIGINLLTIGTAVQGILGINLYVGVIAISIVSAIYMHGGGQTSVIMTDLFQGFLLLAAGFIVFIFGILHLGGFSEFWNNIPTEHKLPFAGFNSPNSYHTVGLFWSDAITGTIAFYCMNQGILMRFMSARSVRDGKKAICVVVLILMPIAAVAVSNAGWIGTAMVNKGQLPADIDARDIFVKVSYLVCTPGVFGLVMAALVAALMSTLDTLVNAASAVAINDIWRAKIRPGREDQYYLEMARYFALGATALGICLVPVFNSFGSIFKAFSHFTSLVTPPMVVVITLGALWKRFTPQAAFYTLIIGTLISFGSLFKPGIITPFAHGVEAVFDSAGNISPDSYSYMRAFFGVAVSTVLAVGISLFTKPKAPEDMPGMTMATLSKGMELYKGSKPSDIGLGIKIPGTVEVADVEGVSLSEADMKKIFAEEGDLLYVCDSRFWLGGLRSVHVKAAKPHQEEGKVLISQSAIDSSSLSLDKPVTVEKMM